MMAAGIWKEAGSIARRLYDGGVPPTAPRRQITAVGLITAVAGTALFVWLVWTVGPREIWSGFRQIGWNLGWILLLGGLRFAVRAAAWTLCVEPPHTLRFARRVQRGRVRRCDRQRHTARPDRRRAGENRLRARPHAGRRGAHRAGDRERVLHAVGRGDDRRRRDRAAVRGRGSRRNPVTPQLREFSEITVAGIVILFAVAGWVMWRRPAVIDTLLRARRREDGSVRGWASKVDSCARSNRKCSRLLRAGALQWCRSSRSSLRFTRSASPRNTSHSG